MFLGYLYFWLRSDSFMLRDCLSSSLNEKTRVIRQTGFYMIFHIILGLKVPKVQQYSLYFDKSPIRAFLLLYKNEL